MQLSDEHFFRQVQTITINGIIHKASIDKLRNIKAGVWQRYLITEFFIQTNVKCFPFIHAFKFDFELLHFNIS